eukprot:279092-Pyramimonas_sp.AAC.1
MFEQPPCGFHEMFFEHFWLGLSCFNASGFRIFLVGRKGCRGGRPPRKDAAVRPDAFAYHFQKRSGKCVLRS